MLTADQRCPTRGGWAVRSRRRKSAPRIAPCSPLSVSARGGGCTAWNSMRWFVTGVVHIGDAAMPSEARQRPSGAETGAVAQCLRLSSWPSTAGREGPEKTACTQWPGRAASRRRVEPTTSSARSSLGSAPGPIWRAKPGRRSSTAGDNRMRNHGRNCCYCILWQRLWSTCVSTPSVWPVDNQSLQHLCGTVEHTALRMTTTAG